MEFSLPLISSKSDRLKRKYLPKPSESPFGDFPKEWDSADKTTRPPNAAPIRTRINAALEFSKSHQGNGGCSSSLLHGKKVDKDPKPLAGAYRRRPIKPSNLRRYYDRGDIPVLIDHKPPARTLRWKVEITSMDYHYYLPIFFDGLRELEEPYRFLAQRGCHDLLANGDTKILPTMPQLIVPIKTALNTRDPDVIAAVLKTLQQLVTSGPLLGEALVPYYRQILPIFNLFKEKNRNMGDQIDYGQRRRENLGDLIEETLQLFEMHGGNDAFVNIKYMIPTYESCMMA